MLSITIERLLVISQLIILAKPCPIYLTISLMEKKTAEESQLEVNWGPECHNRPEWIGIFTDDPSTSHTHPEARITNIENTSGKTLTEVKIGKIRFPKGWNRNDENAVPPDYPKGKCLPYYVASFNGSELLAVECLKIQPNWMSKSKHIAEMHLKDLFIPGTHSSGAILQLTRPSMLSFLKDYAVAQHFDVWSQLVFGIRYLDLSIGFREHSFNQVGASDFLDNTWIANENTVVNKLSNILDDVKRFVNRSHEVVILDFSSFPIGFYKHPERHINLVHILHEQVGNITYQSNNSVPCYQLSMDDIRKTGKYLIILYPIEELPYPENEYPMLCPTWKRFSTAFMNTSQALDYMRLLYSKKETSPVQDEGWIFHAIKSMEQSLNSDKLQTTKERAAIINPKVTSWLKGPWSLTANIVAMDFFSNTNLIDVAIYANMQKAFNMANKNFVNFEIVSN